MFQEQGIGGHPLVTFAYREIFCHFVGYQTSDQSAELMTAVFEVIKKWWEMKFFKNVFDGLYCPYRKGLILVWFYVVWCLQHGLNFITNKIQTAEGT